MPQRKTKPGPDAARRVKAPRSPPNLHVLLAESQERERVRIGAELHDGVLQSLVRIKLDIEQLVVEVERRAPRDVASELSELVGEVRDCIKEIRAILSDLVPPHLADTDIVEALHRCIDAFRDRYRMQVRRRLEPLRVSLTAEQKLVLFRILQEALNNVQKHANATRVEIELRNSARAVRLRVIDDGRGFHKLEPEPGHCGLQNMRHRAATLGGSTIIRSALGQGTIVIAKIPLHCGEAGNDVDAA